MYIFAGTSPASNAAQEGTSFAGDLMSDSINQAIPVFIQTFLSIVLHPLIIGVIILVVTLKIIEATVIRKRRERKRQENQMAKVSVGNGNKSAFNIKTDLKYELNPSFLTMREASFFHALLPIAVSHQLYVFAKPRIADFVNVTVDDKKSAQFWRCFNEISQKHIDFLVCDVHFRPVMGFEVDDATHLQPDRIARDAIVNAIYSSIGFKVFRVLEFSSKSIEQMVASAIAHTTIG